MALDVNQLDAGRVLRESFERVDNQLQATCPIAETVDITMSGKGCLTYQYILLTALVAKLANPQIDMLSLQVDDTSAGAYAPRTLCKDVIYPFQKQLLFNALDGSNSACQQTSPLSSFIKVKCGAWRWEDCLRPSVRCIANANGCFRCPGHAGLYDVQTRPYCEGKQGA